MKYWLEQEYLYNPGTDLLLNWGDHILERPGMESEREELSEAISAYNRADLMKDVRDAMPLLLENAEKGRLFLGGHPILPSSFESDLWHNAVESLNAYDHLLFLQTAVSDIFSEESAEVLRKLETAYEKLLEWPDRTDGFSYLRLVPLNEWRRERLNRIPEKSHYLYPWYLELSEIQTDAVDLLTGNWPSVREDGFRAISFIRENDRPVVWQSLKTDKTLQSALEKERELEKIVFETIDNSMALRLFTLSNTYARTGIAPERFVSAGLAPIACTILAASPRKEASPEDVGELLESVMNGENHLEKILLTAFCGPYLPDHQRLSVFKRIEAEMTHKDFPLGGTDGLFTKLGLWRDREIDNLFFAESLLSVWDQYSEEAIRSFSSETDAKSVSKSHYIFVINLGRPEYRTNKARLGQMRKALSEETEDTHRIEDIPILFEDSNEILVFVEFDDMDELPILESVESNERMEQLIEELEDIVPYYMGGWYKVEGEDAQQLELNNCFDVPPDPLPLQPDKQYEFIMLGISADKGILNKALEKEELTEDEASLITWIIYLPKEEN